MPSFTKKWSAQNKAKKLKWLAKRFCMLEEHINGKIHVCMRPKNHKEAHICGNCQRPMFIQPPKPLNTTEDNNIVGEVSPSSG